VVSAYFECGAGDAESGAEYGAGEVGSGEILEEVGVTFRVDELLGSLLEEILGVVRKKPHFSQKTREMGHPAYDPRLVETDGPPLAKAREVGLAIYLPPMVTECVLQQLTL
jgi:hypothetical protein